MVNLVEPQWVYVNDKTTIESPDVNTKNTFETIPNYRSITNQIEYDSAIEPEVLIETKPVMYDSISGGITRSNAIYFPVDANGVICKTGDILVKIYENASQVESNITMFKVIGISENSQIILQQYDLSSGVNKAPLFLADASKYVHAAQSDCDTIATILVKDVLSLVKHQTIPNKQFDSIIDKISKLIKFYLHLYYGIDIDGNYNEVEVLADE